MCRLILELDLENSVCKVVWFNIKFNTVNHIVIYKETHLQIFNGFITEIVDPCDKLRCFLFF